MIVTGQMLMVGLTPIYSKCFNITNLMPQTAIFGIFDSVTNDSIFQNSKVFITFRIFKLYFYKS